MAFYRHVLSNLETVGATQGLFAGEPGGPQVRLLDQLNRSVLDIVSWGFSGGARVTEDFSLGLGVVYYRTELEIQSDLYVWDEIEDPFHSPNTYRLDQFVRGPTLFGETGSVAVVGGFLWKIDPRWSLGGRYRGGPTVRLRGEGRFGSVLDFGVPPGTVVELDLVADAELPENYGLGVAYRSTDGRLTVGFEWDRVTYSSSLESLD